MACRIAPGSEVHGSSSNAIGNQKGILKQLFSTLLQTDIVTGFQFFDKIVPVGSQELKNDYLSDKGTVDRFRGISQFEPTIVGTNGLVDVKYPAPVHRIIEAQGKDPNEWPPFLCRTAARESPMPPMTPIPIPLYRVEFNKLYLWSRGWEAGDHRFGLGYSD